MSRDPNPILETQTTHDRLNLTVLLYETVEGVWVAQCLEKNMVSHGPNADAALVAIKEVLQIRVNFDALHNRQPLARLRKADQIYWKAREHAVEYQSGLLNDAYLPAHLTAFRATERISAA